MKLKLLMIIAITLCTLSCRSPRSNIDEPVVITNTDNVRTEYVEKLRIDTVKVFVNIYAEKSKQIVFDSTSHLETKFARSDAWINSDGSLGHSIENIEQKISTDVPVVAKDTETRNDSVSRVEVPVYVPQPYEVERKFTWWEKFKIDSFWYLVALLILALIYIFRKRLVSFFKLIIRLV